MQITIDIDTRDPEVVSSIAKAIESLMGHMAYQFVVSSSTTEEAPDEVEVDTDF